MPETFTAFNPQWSTERFLESLRFVHLKQKNANRNNGTLLLAVNLEFRL